MSDKDSENKSAAVPAGAKQAEEIHVRWMWVERSVWSERMLQTLETGIKGGKWFSLHDKVWKWDNIELSLLQRQVRDGSYTPLPVRRCWIPKPGSKEQRPLGIPAVRDRIVQGAVRNVLEPIFEHAFADHSYGFRPGRGCKDALRRVDHLLTQGYTWVVDVDFKSYFDTIPHDQLMERVKELISDGAILALIQKYLQAGVMDGLKGWEASEQGTPQGAVISPLLANLYLNALDHLMATNDDAMTRYADDFVVQYRTEAEAQLALERIQQWAEENGLTVHPTKTRIVDATQQGGFDFLGYHFERGLKWPRVKSLDKLTETVRTQTRRTQGRTMTAIIAGVNRTLRGWFAYFQQSQWNTLSWVDSWVRMRLRSILRKHTGRRGRARGPDQHRWPNAYFEQLGLYTLAKARLEHCNRSF